MRRELVTLGRESVWDYPRPPRVERRTELVRVTLADALLAETTRSLRVLETSHPPVYYIPQADVAMHRLRHATGRSWCEFKGLAVYWDADAIASVGWSYPEPSSGYEILREHLAFYPGRVGEATVNGERAQPQQGGFYGGWITANVVGPFKGAPGTHGW